MKHILLVPCVASLFVLASCSTWSPSAVQASQASKEVTRARRVAQCSSHAALTQAEITSSSPLCEHQILVAPLSPLGAVKLAFRLVADEPVRYCFVDDNRERHRAELRQRGTNLVSVSHGTECIERRLAPGDYELVLTHANEGGQDATPDIVHTQWTDADATHPAMLRIATNDCPGCDLHGKELPKLGTAPYQWLFGYAGNYANANLSKSVCRLGGFSGSCTFGYSGVVSTFDGVSFDGMVLGPGNVPYSLGVTPDPGSGTTSFRKATFRNLPRISGPFNTAGDFSDADFTNAAFGGFTGGGGVWTNVTLTGATVEFSSDSYPFGGTKLDVATFRALSVMKTAMRWNTVTVKSSDDLTSLAIDGARNAWVWPKDGAGAVAMKGASFKGSSLSNVTLPCATQGGTLAGALFSGSTVNNVGLSNCNLDGASFTESALSQIDFSNTSMLDVILTTKGGTPAAKALTMTKARVRRKPSADGLNIDALVATGADLSGSNFDGAIFSGSPLLSLTVLDDVSFQNATLAGATFDGAVGKRTHFDSARFEGGSFANVRFTAAVWDAASLPLTKLIGARVCGGSILGTKLGGTDLTSALFPSEDVTVVAADGAVECAHVDGVLPYASLTTSSTTRCPDGALGPCTTAARWTPTLPYPVCCKPSFDDPDKCIRLRESFACTTACDCASLRCTNKVCEK